jgi:hypothetical protein
VTRIYLLIEVYNYDRSPRVHTIEHVVATVEEARHLRDRLDTLMPWQLGLSGNRTGRWLDRNHRIYGFIERVVGIFEETTKEVK